MKIDHVTVEKVEKEVSWLGARLREPSTYAGLGFIAVFFGIHVDPDLSGALVKLGLALGGVLAVVLPEGK